MKTLLFLLLFKNIIQIFYYKLFYKYLIILINLYSNCNKLIIIIKVLFILLNIK